MRADRIIRWMMTNKSKSVCAHSKASVFNWPLKELLFHFRFFDSFGVHIECAISNWNWSDTHFRCKFSYLCCEFMIYEQRQHALKTLSICLKMHTALNTGHTQRESHKQKLNVNSQLIRTRWAFVCCVHSKYFRNIVRRNWKWIWNENHFQCENSSQRILIGAITKTSMRLHQTNEFTSWCNHIRSGRITLIQLQHG